MSRPGGAPAFSLLTDFGYADPYAGELRAVLHRLAPGVPCFDLSHGVPPFSVMTGAFFLAAALPYHAAGMIFVCVVDPGVGSERDFLCLADGNHTLLGPDNGLLSLAYQTMRKNGPAQAWRLCAPSGGTFHGRDFLAPLAAKLALGAKPETLGTALDPDDTGMRLSPDWAHPADIAGGFCCTVLHVDRFGNCILNIPLDHPLPGSGGALLLSPGENGEALPLCCATHYAAITAGEIGLVPGSQGFYELACDRASAAARLSLTAGSICRITAD